MEQDCAQVFSVVANDYPRSSQTSATTEVVFDFNLEERMRCGEELDLR